MEQRTIGFIGGGRITRIFLEGFKNAKVEFDQIVVYDSNDESLKRLQKAFPQVKITNQDLGEIGALDIIFIAVHPPVVAEVIEQIKPYIQEHTILISLAPKITIQHMQILLPQVKSIVRANPSAPNVINEGMNPIAFSETINEEDKVYVMKLFGTIGKTFVVEESKIEAYAVICAMGSTYFWFQLQQLLEMGIQFGLEREEAKLLIKDMMSGTVNTLFFSNLSKEEVMDLVPVRPLGEYEEMIKGFYSQKLAEIYAKIRP